MGNNTSTHECGVKAMGSEQDTNKTSCATFATQSSDDAISLEALVEATREETSDVPPRRNVFSRLFASSEAPQQPQQPPRLPPIKTRLSHCETDEQHRAYTSQFLDRTKGLQGEEGLRKAGFEFKKVYCLKHKPQDHNDSGTLLEEKKCDTDSNHSSSPVQLQQSFYGKRYCIFLPMQTLCYKTVSH